MFDREIMSFFVQVFFQLKLLHCRSFTAFCKTYKTQARIIDNARNFSKRWIRKCCKEILEKLKIRLRGEKMKHFL